MDGLHGVLDHHVQNERKEHNLERVPEKSLLARWLLGRRRLRHVRPRHPLAVQLHPRAIHFIAQAICLWQGASLRNGTITPSCSAWLKSSLSFRIKSSAA